MTEKRKEALPTWAKVTIAVVAVGILSFIALVIIGGMFLADTTKKLVDPKNVDKIEQSIVQMENPLPRGFHRLMAIDLMGLSEAAYIHPRSGLEIVFVKVEQAPRSQSADKMLQWYLNNGTNVPGMQRFSPASTPLNIESQGHMSVGGEDMPYAVGNRTFSNIRSEQLIGVIVPHDKKKPVVVIGQCTRSPTYQMELTKRFFAAVKAF